jgi:hypothetical protein
MTERYPKLARQHIRRIQQHWAGMWNQCARRSRYRCTRIVRARKFLHDFFRRQVIEHIGGQGRNRTADAGLFGAAYRFAEVV